MELPRFRAKSAVTWLCFLVSIASPAVAQNGVGYRLVWPNVPAEATGIYPDKIKVFCDLSGDEQVLVVGYYHRSDRPGRRAFVYDHYGYLNASQPQKFWDIEELVGPESPSWAPSTHIDSRFSDVNCFGRVCGSLRDDSGANHLGFFFDLVGANAELQALPPASPSDIAHSGWRVNDNGQVLVLGTSTGSFADGEEIATYDPATGQLILIPLQIDNSLDIFFNSSMQIVGRLDDASTVRHQVLDADNNGISDGQFELFPNVLYAVGLNDYAQFAGRLMVQVRPNKWNYYVARIGANGAVEWQYNGFRWFQPFHVASDINNSGDVVNATTDDRDEGYYFHEGNPTTVGDEKMHNIMELIIPESDPSGTFRNSTEHWQARFSDRDSSGFGWFAGREAAGVNPDGSVRYTMYLLVPEVVAAPLIYSSTHAPLAIPDYNAAGVTSTIPVADDVTIADLTVTLNISHPRLSDLQATLIGPNGSVPLTTLNGLNDIGNFDATSSLGNWQVKVYDTVRKQTGTLNGWTLKIEY